MKYLDTELNFKLTYISLSLKRLNMKQNKKINLGLIFGGKSAEHEVAINSARSVYQALDKNKYNIILIGINKDGSWHHFPHSFFLSENNKISKNSSKINPSSILGFCDVVFPVLHGTYGEDGTIQGLFEIFNIPYTGPDVLGSAIGMDKDVTKRLLRDAGILIPEFEILNKHEAKKLNQIIKKFKFPVFVKPANLGSSVGISRVNKKNELKKAVNDAFLYDNKVLIEQGIFGREIECAVLGNEYPAASELGEIIPHDSFYSYKAKYIDENGASLIIPVKLPNHIKKAVQKIAVDTFKALCCTGMARVDFFLEKGTNKIYVNEINTIPGFTKISMYPKLWGISGLPYSKLLDQLISLAIDRHKKKNRLKTNYNEHNIFSSKAKKKC